MIDFTNKAARKLSKVEFSAIRAMNAKICEIESQGHSVIRLNHGLPNFDTPEHIKLAAIKALERGQTQYCPNLGLVQLREVIAQKLYQDNELSYSNDEIMVTNGVSEGIFITLNALLDKGDEALVFEPVFPPYENGIKLSHASVVKVPTYASNGYLPQIADIKSCLNNNTKMLILINPVNPTGAIFSLELLEQIAQLVLENDLLVVADEIYEKVIFDSAQHHSFAKLPHMRTRTVVLNGFSKFYSMSGWRLGYIAADIQLMQSILKLQQNCAVCSNTFAQFGAIKALIGPQDIHQQRVLMLDERRKLLCNGIESIDYLRFVRPLGALYIYAQIHNTQFDAYQLSNQLLHNHHVAVVPWNSGHIRLSYTASEQQILAGIEKLSQLQCY